MNAQPDLQSLSALVRPLGSAGESSVLMPIPVSERGDHQALTLVVPCFNEELALPKTVPLLLQTLDVLVRQRLVSAGSHILLVDDGSTDETWALIEEWHARDPRVHGVKLSANRGHQYALLAGLMQATGDLTVSLDADLQDDLDAIGRMVHAYRTGVEVVYGVRSDRSSDSAFKRSTAQLYYRALRRLGIRVVHNHADFRLMSRCALEQLRGYGEVNLYLRGVIPLMGFKSAAVTYSRAERIAGVTKYPLRKMLALAANGLLSFSTAPLRLITWLGAAVGFAAFGIAAWALAVAIFTDRAVPGWTSTVVPMALIGGLQLVGLGVVGSYVGRVLEQVKGRPRYIIERSI